MSVALPPLMLITDRHLAPPGRCADLAARLARNGIALTVQLREKDLPGAELLEMAIALADALQGAQMKEKIQLVVNGRYDVALAAGARAVHLPADGPSPRRVREAVDGRLGIGISVHSAGEAAEAVAAGVDYLLFGPVFPTRGKPEGQGPEALAAAVRAAGTTPLLAVGGVTPGRAAACQAAGASGVAVIRALLEAEDPVAAARQLQGPFEATRGARREGECRPTS